MRADISSLTMIVSRISAISDYREYDNFCEPTKWHSLLTLTPPFLRELLCSHNVRDGSSVAKMIEHSSD